MEKLTRVMSFKRSDSMEEDIGGGGDARATTAVFEDELQEARTQLAELRASLEEAKTSHSSIRKELALVMQPKKKGHGKRSSRNLPSPHVGKRRSGATTTHGLEVLHLDASPQSKVNNRFEVQGTNKSLEEQEQEVLNRLNTFGLSGTKADEDIFNSTISTKSIRKFVRTLMTSRLLESVVMFLIHINLIVVWLEIDTPDDDPIYPSIQAASYALTVLFFIESMLHIIFLPKWWKYKDVAVDAFFCVIVMVGETMALLKVVDEGVKYLTVLRCLRLLRFAWKIRNRNSGRPLRVLISSLEGCSWNFLWVAALLFMTCYLPALLTRVVFEDPSEDEVAEIFRTYFPSVPIALVTYMQMFFGSLDYYLELIRPLLHSDQYWYAGVIIILYVLFMFTGIANCVIGLVVEIIMLSARKSDEKVGKEMLSTQQMNYLDLLRVFRLIDRQNRGLRSTAIRN
mmetsp:Transcript_57908/g.135380  ORF Transcript_57908/g.135380 Transcript_57908/m.135380 type:complete len:455 (-) Transcript_57908:53-1417(-)